MSDDKCPKLSEVKLTSESTDGLKFNKKIVELKGQESAKDLLEIADGWLRK